jgi:hypothetical protein
MKNILIAVSIGFPGIILLHLVCSSEISEGLTSGVNTLRNISGIGTFVIALLLFDRFGLRKDVKSRQLKIVLELVETFRHTHISGSTDGFTYVIHFSGRLSNQLYNDLPLYEHDRTKLITTSPEFIDQFFQKILRYKDEILLPKRIKEKLDAFEFYGTVPQDGLSKNDANHVFIHFKSNNPEAVGIPCKMYPDTTFEKFHRAIIALVVETNAWIAKNVKES